MPDVTLLVGDAISSDHAEATTSPLVGPAHDVFAGDALSSPLVEAAIVSEATTKLFAKSSISGAVVGGGFVRRAGEIVTDLSAKVFLRSDLRTPVVELSRARSRKFLDQLNDCGSGSFDLQANDPDRVLIPDDAVVRFDVKGFAAWSMLIDDEDTKTLAEGEEADQISTFSGLGHLTVLDEAVVFPARGADVTPIGDERVFNWTSVDFNDRGWHDAEQGMRIGEAQIYWQQLPFGEGFPVPSNAWTIWDRRSATVARPPGDCYFRKTFWSNGGALIYAICDDGGSLYFDGQLVITMMGGFAKVYTQAVQCSAGRHTIAVYGGNSSGAPAPTPPFDNPAGVCVAVYACNMSGFPSSPYPDVVTDASWKVAAYPPHAPGMTPGEVIRHCIAEGQLRGCFPEVELSFDDEVDTNGDPWPEVTDIATKIGTSVATFLRELSATYVDVWMSPGSFTLNAYVRDGRGTTRATALSVGGNLASLQHKRKRRVSDVALVRWSGGWHERVDVAKVAARGRHEVLLGLGAVQSLSEVFRVTDRQLDTFGRNRTAITAVLQPRELDGSDQPYRGFLVGDTITVPDFDATPSAERVISMTVTEDENGTLGYVPELKDVILSHDERFAETVLKMSNGTVGGQSIVATPAAMAGSTGPDCCPPVPPYGGCG